MPIEISGKLIGGGAPCLVIAEAGVNHDGELGKALRLVDAAAAAGADAVKFQTFVPESLAAESAPKAEYQGGGESQLAMLRRLALSRDDFRAIELHCRQRNILFLSTPFDAESAVFLDQLGVPAFKLPSGEITNTPLLRLVAGFGKPVILSTGMSTIDEARAAVDTLRSAGARDIVALQCVSNYPADFAAVNLRAMAALGETCGVPVGYSDHTLGIEAAVAAVALGAVVVEKHFTLDSAAAGPDHHMSIEPEELRRLVRAIRNVELALGDGRKRPAAAEAAIAAVARRSVVAKVDIPAGARLAAEHLTLKRPGTGLPPSALDSLIGRVAAIPLAADTLLAMEMLEPEK